MYKKQIIDKQANNKNNNKIKNQNNYKINKTYNKKRNEQMNNIFIYLCLFFLF